MTVSSVASISRALEPISSPGFLRACIALAFICHLILAYSRNVNWDEFYYLSHVYAHLDDRLDRPFQSAFVHAFSWVRYLPGYEVEQIAILRVLMTGFLAVTCYAVYRIAAVITDRTSSLIAAFAFLMSGYVFGFGSGFRADPMAAAGLMSALAIVMTSRMSTIQVLAVAILTALSLLVTIKAVLYVPAFLGALLWRSKDPGISTRIIISGCLGVALAGMLYWAHSSGVSAAADRDTTSSVTDAWRTALLENSLFKRWETFRLWIFLSATSVILLVYGIWRAASARLSFTLIAFTLPFLLSLLFYRNAFDYFLPYITPPMMIAVAVGASRSGPGLVRSICLISMLVLGIAQVAMSFSASAKNQRATIAEVHRLFPEPVAYIDQVGMVSSFKSSAFFMSTWGVQRYRAKGELAVQKAIERDHPPLLLTNRDLLRSTMEQTEQPDDQLMLFQEDSQALRQTYVHHKGAIWLAGRTFTIDTSKQLITLPFPGTYRLDTAAAVKVNDVIIEAGDLIEYDAPFEVSGERGAVVRFVWDTGVEFEADVTLNRRLFARFWSQW